jgi:hypothetical protein
MSVVPFDEEERSANEVLIEAIEAGFESVVVVGYKDGEVQVLPSRIKSLSKLIGSMEIAKDHLFRTWE